MFSYRLMMTPMIILICLAMVCLMFTYPGEGLNAAVRGVSIWWDVLFPALFPFFVISEMLLGFGIVHFIGTLLDPMMRPLFRVPGIGSFVMAMGFASGYPVAARLTSQLWEQKLVNREEGERLVSFTTTSDPIFLIGAVCIGFFHDAGLAAILAISHYGAAVIVAFIMRYHGDKNVVTPSPVQTKGLIVLRAFQQMHLARLADGRSIAALLQQAVQSSLRLVFVIGGLVVFFSVMLELFTLAHIMNVFYYVVQSVLYYFKIPAALSQAVVNGFFEVTIGVKSVVMAGSTVPLINQVAIAAFVLSWSGLSVHAQVASLLQHTDMRYRPFAIARFIHGLISAFMIYLLWTPMLPLRAAISSALPAFIDSPLDLPLRDFPLLEWTFSLSGILLFSVFAVIIVLFIIYSAIRRVFRLFHA